MNTRFSNFCRELYSAFFLTVAIGNCMVKLSPPVNFCSDENIQTIFGTKLEDFLNYRIVYNSISQTVEKVVKKNFKARRNNTTSSGRQNSVPVGSTQPAPDQIPLQCDTYKIVEEKHFEQFL
jgi:hypothetical protein